MNLLPDHKAVLSAILKPSEFFRSADGATAFGVALKNFAAILFVSAFFLFLSALFNVGELKKVAAATGASLPGGSIFPGINQAVPWNQLAAPLLWFIFTFSNGLFRYISIVVFGETNRSLVGVQTIAMYAVMPLIIFATVGGIFSNLNPMIPGPDAVTSARVWIVALFFLLGLAWEARISIAGFRAYFGQNIGRALVSYVSAYLLGGVLCCGSLMFVLFWAQIR